MLNSVFLHHCVQAGLDMAIVNPAHITPYAEIDQQQRDLADDLILARRGDALERFIDYFEQHQVAEEEAADPTGEMAPDEAIHWKILHRKKEGVEELVDEAVGERNGERNGGRERRRRRLRDANSEFENGRINVRRRTRRAWRC